MKRTEINAIELLLFRLPVELKKNCANQLFGHIERSS